MTEPKLFENAIPKRNQVFKDDVKQEWLDASIRIFNCAKHIYTKQLNSGRWQAILIYKEVWQDPLKAEGASEKKAFHSLVKKISNERFIRLSDKQGEALGL